MKCNTRLNSKMNGVYTTHKLPLVLEKPFFSKKGYYSPTGLVYFSSISSFTFTYLILHYDV